MRFRPSQRRRYEIERREFLRYVAAVSAIPTMSSLAIGQIVEQPTFSADPFPLGVASGDLEPDGVVLWTRLAPSPLQPVGGMSAEADSPANGTSATVARLMSGS
jgi:alkaline phosphatase D